jgi:RimJ/RimL family protein N-acetyltransferase
MAPVIDLRPLTADDVWLTAALETDPVVMKEIGGPITAGEVPAVHARRLTGVLDGSVWYFTIRVDDRARPVGAVCIWTERDPDGSEHSEAGWAVLPAFQGRGIARAAVRELIRRAHEDGRWGDIHAFPSVTNPASNALCRGAGFELVGEVDVEYRGRPLRCNDWLLRAPAAEGR